MRPFFILAPLGVLYLALLGRLVQLHAYPRSVEHPVSGILNNETVLPGTRGVIVSHDGKPLAYDRPAFELVMSSRWLHRRYSPENRPEDLSDADIWDEINLVAEGCSLEPAILAAALLDPEISYKVLRRGVDPFEAGEIRNLLRGYRGMGGTIYYPSRGLSHHHATTP